MPPYFSVQMVRSLWLVQVAAQLEKPFGTDDNDLPLTFFQTEPGTWRGWIVDGFLLNKSTSTSKRCLAPGF